MEWYVVLAIVVGVIVFVIILLFVYYFSYITPYPTGKVNENISIVQSGIVNCFVYSKGSKRIIIDTGTAAKKIARGLLELDIEPNSISHVFLTHSDSDHVGGISLFENARLFLGEKSKIKTPENYKFLKDKEIIEIDEIKVQAISTPGHRLGHTVYLIDDEFLFTGDAIRLKNGAVKPFLRIFSSDFKKQLESIEKISQLKGISILFTAHNGFTTNFEKAIENWKE